MDRISRLMTHLLRKGVITGAESHCIVSSVKLHSELVKPTTEYGTDAHELAKEFMVEEKYIEFTKKGDK
tara:strand:+ start:270 stop:476 length:207 start_codon:yes stop_codon:yes gene_type:complete